MQLLSKVKERKKLIDEHRLKNNDKEKENFEIFFNSKDGHFPKIDSLIFANPKNKELILDKKNWPQIKREEIEYRLGTKNMIGSGVYHCLATTMILLLSPSPWKKLSYNKSETKESLRESAKKFILSITSYQGMIDHNLAIYYPSNVVKERLIEEYNEYFKDTLVLE